MPFLTWGLRRQLAVFSIFAAVVLLFVFGIIYYLRPEPSCFDRRQNQGEEGVDCGGPCTPCAEKIHDLSILWTRHFLVRDGFYDVAALLENSNQFLKTDKLVYAIKLFDENGVLLAIRENSTFVLPSERFVIFEPNINTQNRVPKNAVLELRGVNWRPGDPAPLRIDILKKEFFTSDFVSRMDVVVKNQSPSNAYENIEVSIALQGENGTVLGVSRTTVGRLDILEERTIIFTWPRELEGVLSSDIFLRQIP